MNEKKEIIVRIEHTIDIKIIRIECVYYTPCNTNIGKLN